MSEYDIVLLKYCNFFFDKYNIILCYTCILIRLKGSRTHSQVATNLHKSSSADSFSPQMNTCEVFRCQYIPVQDWEAKI